MTSTHKSRCHVRYIANSQYRTPRRLRLKSFSTTHEAEGTYESRDFVAHHLRWCRSQPRRYTLIRCFLGVYMVVEGNTTTALIKTR